ncbi:MAG: hypothetical protein HYV68_02940 [Candidatus Taylorbacteria bacterium]|nr:hypothetical protein [Candidatus Taylorbacteria bacterium]
MVLFIFGATGDLTRRKIVPALRSLNIEGLQIIALGRKDLNDKTYEQFVCGEGCFDDIHSRPKYEKVRFADSVVCEHCDAYHRKGEINYFYSALPPAQIASVIGYVGGVKRAGYDVRLLIEKPFGYSLANALELKRLLDKWDLASDVYISDHYLFKDGIRTLEPKAFDSIKMVSLESLGLEMRAGYYDGVGALKDMVQSHFLNIAFKLLDDPVSEFKDFEVVAYERGQYGNGRDSGYAAELGKTSETETYARVVLKTRKHAFEFETGKAFDRKVGFIDCDGEQIRIDALNDDYLRLFTDFFADRKKDFATVENSILAWEIVERIEQHRTGLKHYGVGTPVKRVLKDQIFLAK